MATKLKIIGLTAVLAVLTLSGNAPGYAQGTPQPQQEAVQKALVQQAVREVRAGSFEALSNLRDEQGDKVLPYFADLRFDPDVKVREAALDVAGDTYNSLLFLLPMINDVDADIADKAASRVTDVRRPQAQFQRLDASEVVRRVELAIKVHPDFVRRSPEILLLLAQFQRNAQARRLVNQLIKDNQWNVSISATRSADWNKELVTALLARYEMGSVTLAQVLKVLDASPKARTWFLETVNFLTDETLLRYAISLLYDTTVHKPGGEHVREQRVYYIAAMAFCLATDMELKSTSENGVPKYDPKDIAKLYKFYGLQMQPNQ